MALTHSFHQSLTHNLALQTSLLPRKCQALFWVGGHGPALYKRKEGGRGETNGLFLLGNMCAPYCDKICGSTILLTGGSLRG